MTAAIATLGVTHHLQPASAQIQSHQVAGRWYCQNRTRGLTKTTSIVAVMTEMAIDAKADGTFQAQQVDKSAYGTFQVVGGGQWQLQQNHLTFAGQGQSSDPNTYGMAQPMIAMGSFQDANTIVANFNDGQFANSYACRKVQ